VSRFNAKTLVLLVSAFLLPAAADAGKGKRVPKKPPATAPAPKADAGALKELMGDYKWGMSSTEVLAVVEKKIAANFEEQIKKTPDVFEQNRLRKHIKTEVADVKKTEIAFSGQKTGWDVSIVEGEFGHKNDESMLVWQERDAQGVAGNQRFFFFVDGKLWKMFIAYNMEAYKDRTFDVFRSAMEDRYGNAAEQTRLNAEGKPVLASIYWRGQGSYLRAIDLLQFYANFCLAISDDSVEKWIYERRQERFPKAAPRPYVKGPGGNTDPQNDPNANVVEEITGGGKKPITPPKESN
jgi:hypothetical protein